MDVLYAEQDGYGFVAFHWSRGRRYRVGVWATRGELEAYADQHGWRVVWC